MFIKVLCILLKHASSNAISRNIYSLMKHMNLKPSCKKKRSGNGIRCRTRSRAESTTPIMNSLSVVDCTSQTSAHTFQCFPIVTHVLVIVNPLLLRMGEWRRDAPVHQWVLLCLLGLFQSRIHHETVTNLVMILFTRRIRGLDFHCHMGMMFISRRHSHAIAFQTTRPRTASSTYLMSMSRTIPGATPSQSWTQTTTKPRERSQTAISPFQLQLWSVYQHGNVSLITAYRRRASRWSWLNLLLF